ncbi:MAG: RidA family protein [Bradymonadales bacterium]|nr:MAG: RidA family protein [Bradymonadales bacterium]
MNIETIETREAPQALGPYSQAKKVGNTLYLSGQIPLDPKDQSLVAGGIREQTERVCLNLKAVVEAAGGSLSSIVKTTCLLKNMSDFGDFNEVYGKFFSETKPARATFEVARLPKDVLVEVEAIAYL